MTYASIAELKIYKDISGGADDALLESLIARAQQAIDTYTHRTFAASADTTRYFTVGEDTDGDVLWFDEDICSITTVTTDADGDADVVSSANYVTMPRNRTPYYGIKLLSSSSFDWTYTDDPEAGISVTGKWGYSTAAPDDIKQACVRWSAYMYAQKDAQVFDVTAIPDAGVIQVPQGIPADVRMILEPYVKRV